MIVIEGNYLGPSLTIVFENYSLYEIYPIRVSHSGRRQGGGIVLGTLYLTEGGVAPLNTLSHIHSFLAWFACISIIIIYNTHPLHGKICMGNPANTSEEI